MRSGTTKLPFAQFEERMIERDYGIKKEDFLKRRMRVNWDVIEKELALAK